LVSLPFAGVTHGDVTVSTMATSVGKLPQLESLKTATWDVWIAVIVLAVGGYVVAYSIWYGLTQRYRVDQVTPFALLMPLVGVLAGAIILGEHLSVWVALGGLAVLGGLAFTLREPARGR
jgi:O-acetylserine/cysteine efflux transporter